MKAALPLAPGWPAFEKAAPHGAGNRDCRFVVHHDLSWNPSTIEQRAGRVDRIGSKAEKARCPIHVYLPFVTATQDEKMFRVVRDRERWFSVVMGEKYQVDEATTEKLAERVVFPEEAARELAFDLSVGETSDGGRGPENAMRVPPGLAETTRMP